VLVVPAASWQVASALRPEEDRAKTQAPRPPQGLHIEFMSVVTAMRDGVPSVDVLRGSGDVNLTGGAASARFRITQPNSGLQDVVLVDDTLYLKLSSDGSWISQPIAGPIGVLVRSFASPDMLDVRPLLQAFALAGAAPERLDDGRIGDQAVVHHRVSLSADQVIPVLMRTGSPQARALIGLASIVSSPTSLLASLQQLTSTRFTYDLWLGIDDGIPYRISQRSDRADSSIVVTIDSTPLSQPAPIAPPR
jgi:hypothetical protein